MHMQYKFLFKACVCVTNLPRNVSETQCMRNAYVFHQLCNACAYHKAQAQHCGHRCCRRLYAKAHRSSENTNVLARTKTHAHALALACTHMHTCTRTSTRKRSALAAHACTHICTHNIHSHALSICLRSTAENSSKPFRICGCRILPTTWVRGEVGCKEGADHQRATSAC